MASMMRVNSRPAAPTKGFPLWSSSKPGPSPTKTSRALGLPSPKTMFFRLADNLQRRQSPRSARIFANLWAVRSIGRPHCWIFLSDCAEQLKPSIPTAARCRRLRSSSSSVRFNSSLLIVGIISRRRKCGPDSGRRLFAYFSKPAPEISLNGATQIST